jgi:hypothetical protein
MSVRSGSEPGYFSAGAAQKIEATTYRTSSEAPP